MKNVPSIKSNNKSCNRKILLAFVSSFVRLARVYCQRSSLAVVVGATLFVSMSAPAFAAPAAPQPVYTEDFSTGTPPAGVTAVSLVNYTSSTGVAYSAASGWLPGYNACNGWLLNNGSGNPGSDSGCTDAAGRDVGGNQRAAWYFLRYMSYMLGLAHGKSAADAQTNNVLAAMTNRSNQAQTAGTMIKGEGLVSGVGGRYYASSAWFAEMNCNADNPNHDDAVEEMSLLVGGVLHTQSVVPCSAPITAAAISPHAPSNPRVGVVRILHAYSPAVLLSAASPLGLQIDNKTASGNGNDVAVDFLQILDVTPQLEKAFSPSQILEGETSTLTFTITNTTDLLAKNGWSFTDNLPSDVVVASPLTSSTTCNAGVVTATPGSSSITASGNLPTGAASCTVSVDVTSSVQGTYTNDSTNMSNLTGLLPPLPAALIVNDAPIPVLEVTKTVNPATALTAGDNLTYTVTVANTGQAAAANVSITDALPPGIASAGIAWTCTATGATCPSGASGADWPFTTPPAIPTLPAAGVVTWVIDATVADVAPLPASIVNTVTVGTDTLGALCADGITSPPCSAMATTLLRATPPVRNAAATVPTLNGLTLMLLMALLGAVAVWRGRGFYEQSR